MAAPNEDEGQEEELPALGKSPEEITTKDEIVDDEVVDTIKVLVRIRPIIGLEIENGDQRDIEAIVEADKGKEVVIKGKEARHKLRCEFDEVLGPEATQSDVYNHVSECAKQVARGFNATILAYGQTGSGKSHTMFGPLGWHEAPENSGLIPRAVTALFDMVGKNTKTVVYASFVQIYREQIFDMLRDPQLSSPLDIHYNTSNGDEIFVSGLSEYAVRSADDCATLLKSGEQNRTVRETHMNEASSRSHSIFSLLVEQRRIKNGSESTLRSKFNLVDLAGSEKWDTKREMHEAHVAEMTKINLSLHTLGKCVAALSKASKQKQKGIDLHVHVPYRESKLTRLLQDSLGGNSMTRLIATLSPARDCVEESISTLRFADRARSVVVTVRRNEQRPVDFAMVQRLQKEVVRLRTMLRELTLDASATSQGKNLDIGKLLKELERLKAENEDLRRNPSQANNASLLAGTKTASSIVPLPPLNGIPSTKSMSQVTDRLEAALKRNEVLEKALENVDRATKSFFAFDIEEDGLRRQIDSALTSAASHTEKFKKPIIEGEIKPETTEPQFTSAAPSQVLQEHIRQQAPLLAREEAGPRYRVRTLGATTKRTSNWIDPQIERAEALKRELKDTKARMKRHAQMREWLKRKNEQEAELEQREIDAREAESAAAAARDAKFKRRALKQKQKLEKYYQKMSSSGLEQLSQHSDVQVESNFQLQHNDDDHHLSEDDREVLLPLKQEDTSSPVRKNNNNMAEEEEEDAFHHADNPEEKPEQDYSYRPEAATTLSKHFDIYDSNENISTSHNLASAAAIAIPIQKQQPDIRFF